MSLTFKITNYPTGINPSSVAIGDLNGDGRPDLVTANIGGDPLAVPTPAGTVSVLLGSSGGTFPAATPPSPILVTRPASARTEQFRFSWAAAAVPSRPQPGTRPRPGSPALSQSPL